MSDLWPWRLGRMDSDRGAPQGLEAQLVTAAIDPPDRYLLSAASPPDRRWLERYLAKPVRERSAEQVARIVDLMDVHRNMRLRRRLRPPHRRCRTQLGLALAGVPPSHHVAFIAGLVPYVLERTR
jgi:hypothetical protein